MNDKYYTVHTEQSKALSTPYLSLTTIKSGFLHCHLHLNAGVRVVVADLKVL